MYNTYNVTRVNDYHTVEIKLNGLLHNLENIVNFR